MACSRDEPDFNSITDTLINTFGAVLSRDVIYTIVESCSGDLNYAANAIMSITNESDRGHDSGWTAAQTKHGSSRNSHHKTQRGNMEYNRSISYSQPIPASIEMNALSQNATNCNTFNSMSYAQASLINGIQPSRQSSVKHGVAKNSIRTKKIHSKNIWTETIRRIVTYHNKGTRTLVFMRGAPGSGKSYLARQIVEITVGTGAEHMHIFSTDDYFMRSGFYRFDKMWLSEAHAWNKKRATEAMDKGVSPVIIDNTNVAIFEMQSYVEAGVKRGYAIEIVEPDTPWAKKASHLKVKNKHNVPEKSILRMLDALKMTITPERLLSELNIVYPPNMQPPVLRFFPEIIPDNNDAVIHVDTKTKEKEPCTSLQNCNEIAVSPDTQIDDNGSTQPVIENFSLSFDYQNQNEAQQDCHMTDNADGLTHNECQNINIWPEPQVQVEHQIDTKERMQINNIVDNTESYKSNIDVEPFESEHNAKYMQEIPQSSAVMPSPVKECEENFNKTLEEFEKVENEWENGEAWEEDINEGSSNANTKSDSVVGTQAKPPREKKVHVKENGISMYNDNNNDWRKITMFMPSFTENSDLPVKLEQNAIETKSSETSMEIGDTNICKNQYKVISAVSRDININYVPNLNKKVPKNLMLDKSSMTNEPTNIVRQHRCKNEDKHFVRFRNMFKHFNKDDLRYIFDKCCGDVNWAVSIVLDDMATDKIESVTADEQSDTEDESEEPCECTAHYDIIPDITPTRKDDEEDENISVAVPSTSGISNNGTPVKKHKKDAPSDTSLALKRHIEQNIVISSEYRSINYVKSRKERYRQMYDNLDISEAADNSNPDNAETLNFDAENTDTSNQDSNTPSPMEDLDSESESDNYSGLMEVEKTVNINIGYEFLGQLDKLFGRGDMVYTENIEPRINMPLSLLNEINALWMESLMYQLEAESKIHEELIKQDEDFARELARKEEEVRVSGKETEEPNFKEVMDMELALRFYHKDCNKWQKDIPKDIAAKLTAQKLYNLFPEISHRDLDEIHMAHDHNFQRTVGVLLMSSGRSEVVKDENGINKFIMAGELQRQQKMLNEEKKKLQKELEWPALPEKITLDVVNNYRNEAESHLKTRNMSFMKATDYMSRGMSSIATFYSEVARLHTMMYEKAQSIAAASLMQYHSDRYKNSETLDLHYLRVNEAREALDVFLDIHIRKLRENAAKRSATLFFITGRGLHSIGGPKVKPAVKKRLEQRNLVYCERNPGLLTVKICAGDKLTGQIT